MDRLYVIVRADLAPGLQLAQSCHAVSMFADVHPKLFKAWVSGSNNIVVLHVPDELELRDLLDRAGAAGVATGAFFEPDVGDELTALALADTARPLVSSLPLAMRRAA